MPTPDDRSGTTDRSDEARWYACHTRSRHEKKVDRVLAERGFETFLPLVRQMRQWKDRKKAVEFVMFPGYTFVRLRIADVSRVLSVPGTVALVRHGDAPAAIAEQEIENVRRLTAALGRSELEPEAAPLPEGGTRVLITEGPFAGIEAIVAEARGAYRVVVGLQAIGQGLSVNVDPRVLTPVPSA